MSKLFELLKQTAKQQGGTFDTAVIGVFHTGQVEFAVKKYNHRTEKWDIVESTALDNEEELIAKLSAYLVRPLPKSADLDQKFDEIEQTFAPV